MVNGKILLGLAGLAAAIGLLLHKKTPEPPAIEPLPPTGGGVADGNTDLPRPRPTSIPALRPYEEDKTTDIWRAKDPSSYITPDNEWVKYYASQLYVELDGRIRYKKELIPFVQNPKGDIIKWINKPFINNYTWDIYAEFFGAVDKNNVPWVMPDFYLYHGQRGVCSAWAATVTSMMLSGEMSVWKDGKLVKQVIPAEMVLGYAPITRDGWVEYRVYDKDWITSTAMIPNPVTHEGQSATNFMEKTPTFKAVLRFSDAFKSAA